MRSRGSDVWVADSTDSGATWTAARKLTPVNAHPADLCALGDGRLLMTVGNRIGPFGVVCLVSDQNGEFDWQNRFAIVNDALTRDCGYPSSVLLKDGRVLTVYYATKVKDHPEWGVHCGAVVYDPAKERSSAPTAVRK
jgi:hypothetical protein